MNGTPQLCPLGVTAEIGFQIEKWRAVDAIEAAHENIRAFDFDELDALCADRIGPHRRAQAECAVYDAVIRRALLDEIAARLVQPIKDFELFMALDTVERRHPRLENFDPADRSIRLAAARTLRARRPRRVDAADENEAAIAGAGKRDGNFVFADLVMCGHAELSQSDAGLKPAFSRKKEKQIHNYI